MLDGYYKPHQPWLGIMVVFRVDNQGSQIFKYSVLIYNHNYQSNANMFLIHVHDFYFFYFFIFWKGKRTTQKPIASFMKPNDSLIYFLKITRISGSFYFDLFLNTHLINNFFPVKKIKEPHHIGHNQSLFQVYFKDVFLIGIASTLELKFGI